MEKGLKSECGSIWIRKPITNDDDDDELEDEDVIAESLCKPSKMLYMLE